MLDAATIETGQASESRLVEEIPPGYLQLWSRLSFAGQCSSVDEPTVKTTEPRSTLETPATLSSAVYLLRSVSFGENDVSVVVDVMAVSSEVVLL